MGKKTNLMFGGMSSIFDRSWFLKDFMTEIVEVLRKVFDMWNLVRHFFSLGEEKHQVKKSS